MFRRWSIIVAHVTTLRIKIEMKESTSGRPLLLLLLHVPMMSKLELKRGTHQRSFKNEITFLYESFFLQSFTI